MRAAVTCIALMCFASFAIADERYQLTDDLGQTDVDQAYMQAQVSDCVDVAEDAPEMKECAGRFASACMEEEPDWGYTTTGMYFCTEAEAAAWESVVQVQLVSARITATEADASDVASENNLTEGLPYRVPSLLEAQRTWEAYRDAECLVQYLRWRGGTGAKLLGASCRLEMTAQRAVALYLLTAEKG